ncbi:uncharacterized protein PFL1_00813 [Pseudozyma flocculosa PF-1]|uniref:Uncharacterized protein n=1 Tax=Pseudozyma flocculosa TaxID=84751 RepID=A0A5C3F2S5_9BASI|nr:uncharacterized protein PFL1_00813 [Pseudozyma flocculosa PF-1]EPQ31478.1 hypothetical protein PFL1_00813 [Pseudozyma flocculosa PF-1]SPO38738.1 uncharacterized protein PSFLO_04217 [Pseudozyma flocculosa]
MFSTVVRFSAALARQPAKTTLASATSPSITAGLTTSASTQSSALVASPFTVNEDGRVCSRNRRQHVYDPEAPLPPSASQNWANAAARNKDARDLAGF